MLALDRDVESEKELADSQRVFTQKFTFFLLIFLILASLFSVGLYWKISQQNYSNSKPVPNLFSGEATIEILLSNEAGNNKINDGGLE